MSKRIIKIFFILIIAFIFTVFVNTFNVKAYIVNSNIKIDQNENKLPIRLVHGDGPLTYHHSSFNYDNDDFYYWARGGRTSYNVTFNAQNDRTSFIINGYYDTNLADDGGFYSFPITNIVYRSDYKLVIEHVSGSFINLDPDNNLNFVEFLIGPHLITSDELPTNQGIKEFTFDNNDIEAGILWMNIYNDFGIGTGGFKSDYRFKLGLVPVNDTVTSLGNNVFYNDTYDNVYDVDNKSLISNTTFNLDSNGYNSLDDELVFTSILYNQTLDEHPYILGYYDTKILNGLTPEFGLHKYTEVDINDPLTTVNGYLNEEVIWTNEKYNKVSFGNFDNGDPNYINKLLYTNSYSTNYLLRWSVINDGGYLFNFEYHDINDGNISFNVFDSQSPISSFVYFNVIFEWDDEYPDPPDFTPIDPEDPDPVRPEKITIEYYYSPEQDNNNELFFTINVASSLIPFFSPPSIDNNDPSFDYAFDYYIIMGGEYDGIIYDFDEYNGYEFMDANNVIRLLAVYKKVYYPEVSIKYYYKDLNTHDIILYHEYFEYLKPGRDIIGIPDILPNPDLFDWSTVFYSYNDPSKYSGDIWWYTIYGGMYNGVIIDFLDLKPINGFISNNTISFLLNVEPDPDGSGGSGGSGGQAPPVIEVPGQYNPITGVNSIILVFLDLFGMNNPTGFIFALLILSVVIVVITVYFKLHFYFAVIFIGLIVALFTYLNFLPTYVVIVFVLTIVFFIVLTIKNGGLN